MGLRWERVVMPIALNEDIAGHLEEVARVLSEQGANHFRVQAYERAAATLRGLDRAVADIFAAEGITGLESIPGVGESIAHSIRDMLRHGRLAMLDRLRGEHDPIALLSSVPGIGKGLAWKLHDDLEIETLEQLEQAAHDGRLAGLAGLGAKRLAGIRDSLAHRLGRVRKSAPPKGPGAVPVAELLAVDREYRRESAANTLKRIAPRRFNPAGEAWLPVMHTTHGSRHYTAMFSNTARAHALHKTSDWVVLYSEDARGEQQHTVITSEFGPLRGLRIVRGREHDCAAHYRKTGAWPPAQLQLIRPSHGK